MRANSKSGPYMSAMSATRTNFNSYEPPNLPGFASKKERRQMGTRRPRKQCFMMQQGIAYEKPPQTSLPKREMSFVRSNPSLLLGRTTSQWATLTTSASIGSFAQMPNASNQRPAQWMEQTGKVLKFNAYFKEAVNEAGGLNYGENYRVRKMAIHYYLEDDTMEIVEVKTENSGMPQGNFVKRHLVQKNRRSGATFTLDDLYIGNTITVYGRTYHITGCDPATKGYLESTRGDVIEKVAAPEDRFTRMRAEQQNRETGNDHTVSRNKRMHEMKKFMEATLGNSVNKKSLGGFLKHKRDVLRFACVWDDRKSLYGDRIEYFLHFFLADSSMEIRERHRNNDGRDPFPLMLKRSRPRKQWKVDSANGRADDEREDQYYTWQDLAVGRTVTIYNRDLQLVDADNFTREWYWKQGSEFSLDPPIDLEQEERNSLGPGLTREEIVEQKLAELPPWNGFGSEWDSAQNCKTLVPKPPKTPFDRLGQKLQDTILRFKGKFDPKFVKEDDAMREFVFDYYTKDGQMMVSEPPLRNSGVIGGRFLKKAGYKDSVTKEAITPAHLQEGNIVTVHGFRFLMTEVDAKTQSILAKKKNFNASLLADI